MKDADMVSSGEVAGDAENGCATDHAENGSGKLPSGIKYRTLTPHLIVQAPLAADAISFYKKAFGGEEVKKTMYPKRKAEQDQLQVEYAHLKFGDAEIFVADETARPTNSTILHLDTNDVDAAIARAVAAGAFISEEVSDRSWGLRYGKVIDPYGYEWSIASQSKEKVEVAEETVEAGQAA